MKREGRKKENSDRRREREMRRRRKIHRDILQTEREDDGKT